MHAAQFSNTVHSFRWGDFNSGDEILSSTEFVAKNVVLSSGTRFRTVNVRQATAILVNVADDRFEGNDTRSTATNLGQVTRSSTIDSLVLADSADWYRFTVNGQADSVSIQFQHRLGDLDLALYNARGQRIALSDSVSNQESIPLRSLSAGTYYVRVYGYRGHTNPSYSLSFRATAPTPTPPPTPPPPTPSLPAPPAPNPVPPLPNPVSPTGSFDIQIRYSGVSPALQSIFEQAAARWESIIVGDLPSANFGNTLVDDLLIDASIRPIDGIGNVLGQAGPDRFRSGSQLPFHGIMEFDSADIASMQANGALLNTIIHEIGHVLGIGTLWDMKRLVVGTDTSNPRYVGPQATAEFNSLFGRSESGVPVENVGGPGSRNAHWRESVLVSEVMSSFFGPGSWEPLSRITVASLADLGYSVTFAAADPLRR